MQRSLLFLTALCLTASLHAAEIPPIRNNRPPAPGDAALTAYFRNEVMAQSDRCLADIQSREDWDSKRAEYRRQLQEMLGLWPMPERGDLKAVVTERIENPQFVLDKVYFQASPGLYCTANLFLPKNQKEPVPAILYPCGHLRQKTNDISLGNKVSYQADGEWYARNGYVCLVLDSLLMGEIEGVHVGTRNLGLWWWNSRGYTPAGVEAWFGLRALDYLCTRPEVDTNRIGVTGHSGGGAYSWMVTALDDRIKAAAPMAGMADDQSHVLDPVIDSHCDCNFFINTYRWDFPQVAALAAPRPLLIGGTDRDGLFRVPSTMRIYEEVRRIYRLYGADDKLSVVIAPGPHDYVPELELAAMRFFNRYLKETNVPVESTPKKLMRRDDLKVFDTLPTDAINAGVHNVFVPMAKPEKKSPDDLRAELREKVFAGWPDEKTPLDVNLAFYVKHDGVRMGAWDFTSGHDVRLRVYLLESNSRKISHDIALRVLDEADWTDWLAAMRPAFAGELTNELAAADAPAADPAAFARIKAALNQPVTLAFVAPRGIGPTKWSGDDRRLTQIRRRFMLLGQTMDGMRVWDIRRALQTFPIMRKDRVLNLELRASGALAVDALYAALFEPNVRKLDLVDLPQSHMQGPDYLNVLRVTDIPQVVEAVSTRAEVK